MRNEQGDKIAAFDRVADFNTKNKVKLNLVIKDYKQFQDLFDKGMIDIKDARIALAATPAEDRDTIDDAKKLMGKIVYKFTSRAYEIAKVNGLTSLAKTLHHSRSYVYSAPKNTAVDRAMQLKGVLVANALIFTNVEDEDIVAITTAIAAYVKVKDWPIEKIQEKKVDGTDVLPEFIDVVASAMNSMYNLTVSYFEDSEVLAERKLVNAFALAKQFIGTGSQSTGVSGMVTKGDNPVKAAMINVADTDKSGVSDYQGNYSILHLLPGFYTLNCKTADGDAVIKTVTIHEGEVEEINFEII